jgi:hypothetical protein
MTSTEEEILTTYRLEKEGRKHVGTRHDVPQAVAN